MHRLNSVLVLLLWGGCYFHCSLEQAEVFDVQAASVEFCSGADTDSEDVPCDSCEFVSIGGAITISQLLIIAPLSDFGCDIDNFSLIISLTPATDPDPPPPEINAVAGYSRVLCEELVLTGLPVRGPTVV